MVLGLAGGGDGWRDGGLADLVLALVEQEVGGTGLQEWRARESFSDQ